MRPKFCFFFFLGLLFLAPEELSLSVYLIATTSLVMVSFNCDGCGDVVKKPKLLQHFNRCYAPVTCLDCSQQFNNPNEFKSHNTCVSEAEKYERSVYRGPKHHQTPTTASSVTSTAAVTTAAPSQAIALQKGQQVQEKKRKREDPISISVEAEVSPNKTKKEKKQSQERISDVSDIKNVDAALTTASDPAPVSDSDDAAEHQQDDPFTAADDEAKVIKPLSATELEAFKKKQRKLGIIYISRIPHGMTPAKVRHILSNMGELGRIYLQDGSASADNGSQKKKKKRGAAHYTEGWVEFTSKKVAKATAEMLNAQPIGALAASNSKKSGSGGASTKMGKTKKRFQDDVWTIKYLRGFKWHMLSEQIAQERASHTARLRTELSQSAYEQNDYLKKVERARIQNEKAARRAAKAHKSDSQADLTQGMEKSRTFKQRQPVAKDIRDMQD